MPRLPRPLLALLVGVLVLTGSPAAAKPRVPRPVLASDFADPAVAELGAGYVGFSTGSLVPRAVTRRPHGSWRPAGAALTRLPAWTREGHVWASDVARVGRWWLLFYAAPVPGVGEHGRCIGVARSRTPLSGFEPVGRQPLVCPSYLRKVPTAQDPVPSVDLPRAGVIDPSLHSADGRHHLLYKTDRIPSSIRIVELTRDAQRVRPGSASVELVRYDGVVENPLLLSRPQGHVLLLSEGDFTSCRYRTIWHRSPSLLDWSVRDSGVLMDRGSTRLCGPGGADVAGNRLWFHGWTCRGQALPCANGWSWERRGRLRAIRSMYAARLGWSGGLPVLRGFVEPGR
ncbi:family 43 glycosylhydrolase [Nocardioides gansuensis]|uniref:family 43 glycosylhydrolase n=1 Tax=Nocardioides gansuensis TaxID=2138300 RepID=UPI0014036434|nr:family 43 glycosylhydrolase [Nocardioides gansuensis]